MKDFVLLFKTLYKNQNASIQSDGKKKRLSKKNTLLLSTIPLEVLFCVGLAFVSMVVSSQTVLADLIGVIVFATQMMIIFTSLISIVTTLYNAEDTPFLSSLPLKSTAVFFAKFSIVYVNALEQFAIFALPMILTVIITYVAMGRAIFYGVFPLLIIMTLIAPVLPLFLVTLFSMPAVYIGSYFKGKSALKTAIYVVFYLVLVCAYLVIVYFFNTADLTSNSINESTLNGLSTFSDIAYPNKVLVYYCFGINGGVNFAISTAITVAMIGVMLVLSLLFYKKITQRRVEGKSSIENKSVSFKKENVVVALAKKDFLSIIRNPSVAISSFANTLLAPIFIVLMYFITAQKQAGDQAVGELTAEMMSIGYIVMYSSIFLCGTNMLAILAYTREGRSFYLSKSLPITAKDSIYAKLLLASIVPEILLVVIAFIAIFLYKVTIVSTLLTVITMTIMLVGLNSINIYCDMKKGNVNWSNSNEFKNASKSNTGSIFAIFLAIIPGCLYMFLGIFLAEVAPNLGRLGIMAIFWSIATVISLVLFAIGIYILKNKCEPLYDKIGENQTKIKSAKRAISKNKGGFLN